MTTKVEKAQLIMPFLFEVLWSLAEEVEGPSSSAEIAERYNRRKRAAYAEPWTPSGVSNKLRSLQRRGFIDRGSSGVWSLTEAGDRWVRGES